LSAVDAEVGRHLYEKCIEGYLGDKARILVTHQLQFLKSADHIVLLDKGRVTSQGSYTHLLASGINFAQLLDSENNEQHQTKDSSNEKNLQLHLKYKGTGMEVLHQDKPSRTFKRSASTSLLEVGVATATATGGSGGASNLVDEFEWEEEPEVVRSLGYNYSRRMYRYASIFKFLFQEAIRILILLVFVNCRSRPVVPSQLSKSHLLEISKKKKKADEKTPLLNTELLSPRNREEDRSSGEISLKLYWEYIRAGSSIPGVINLIFSNILVQILFSGSDYFLQYWTSREELLHDNKLNETTGAYDVTIATDEWFGRDLQIIVYSSLVAALFVVSLIRTAGFLVMCLNSSVKLHSMLFDGVLRAPMRFFEVNPVGRVLNRFAKDCGIIDETLPPTLFDTMDVSWSLLRYHVVLDSFLYCFWL